MLLELMLSLALLTLCLLPLFRMQTKLLYNRTLEIDNLRHKFIAHTVLAEIKEDIHNTPSTWTLSRFKKGVRQTIQKNGSGYVGIVELYQIKESTSSKAALIEAKLTIFKGSKEYGPYKDTFVVVEEGGLI